MYEGILVNTKLQERSLQKLKLKKRGGWGARQKELPERESNPGLAVVMFLSEGMHQHAKLPLCYRTWKNSVLEGIIKIAFTLGTRSWHTAKPKYLLIHGLFSDFIFLLVSCVPLRDHDIPKFVSPGWSIRQLWKGIPRVVNPTATSEAVLQDRCTVWDCALGHVNSPGGVNWTVPEGGIRLVCSLRSWEYEKWSYREAAVTCSYRAGFYL